MAGNAIEMLERDLALGGMHIDIDRVGRYRQGQVNEWWLLFYARVRHVHVLDGALERRAAIDEAVIDKQNQLRRRRRAIVAVAF